MTNESILKRVNELKDEIIGHRRFLHENPELSGEEVNTSKFLKEYVSSLGLTPVDASNTGFYAILDTGRPGKTVGLRCDIDALPMQESDENLKGPRVCKSKNDGAMHSCGHDGHMAIEMAVMKVLIENKDQLNGKVVFIFEEGEETGVGIAPMLDSIKSLGIDLIYGTHITSFMDVNTICIDGGPRMAGAKVIDFEVRGRGGHGSRPDLAINPIFATTNILAGLTSAWANQIDVTKTVTLGLCQIHAGTANNIIPDTCSVGGSIRFFDEEEGEKAMEIIKKVTTTTAEAHNCVATFKEGTGTIPIINDDEYAAKARESVESIMPGAIVNDVLWFASESFAKYRSISPIVFIFSGTGNPEIGSGADHHNEMFDLDEQTLINSVQTTIKIISDVLA